MPVTKRDRVWTVALDLRRAAEAGEYSGRYGISGFTVDDVQEAIDEDVARRTISDCLEAMAELGELAVRTSNPHYYRAPRSQR